MSIQSLECLIRVDDWVLKRVNLDDGRHWLAVQHIHERPCSTCRDIKNETFYRCYRCNERVPVEMEGFLNLCKWEK